MYITIQSLLNFSQTLDYTLAAIFASVFYLCRSKLKGAYGVFEILAGFYLAGLSYHFPGEFSKDFSSDFDVVHLTVAQAAFIGAVFVMVRGIDNFVSGWSSKS